jgi:DNA-binding NtrC family response regulator
MASQTFRLLIAAEDERAAHDLAALLVDSGVAARRVTSTDAVLAELEKGGYDVVVCDLSTSDREVIDLVGRVHAHDATLPIIVMVDQGQLSRGVAAVRAGANDFLRKPLEKEEVQYVVGKALRGLEVDSDEPPRSLVLPPELRMIGSSEPMRELNALIRQASDGVATVLVRGESGVGKELVARQVHSVSPRRDGPFVKVHCAALPDTLLESELFGYERGAFTGASARKPGRVELDLHGTRFLVELGDITPQAQV